MKRWWKIFFSKIFLASKTFFFWKKNFGPKIFKNVIFGPKGEKWQSQKILVKKIILVGIDSKCFRTYFKTKILKSKIFPITKFFLGLSHFFISVDSSSKIEKNDVPGGKIKVTDNLTRIVSIYLTLNLEETFFPLSHPTLRIFLIFHLCGQFIKDWKNLKFLDEKIKVLEN